MTVAENQISRESAACARDERVEQLTRGMVKAEEEAYQEFFAVYARRLLLYQLVLMNGDEHSAKELLQQTMIRVAKYIRVFEREEVLWSWLKGVARSCWIDEHRKQTRYGSLLELFRQRRTEPEWCEADAATPEDFISGLLESLEPEERELLEEKYLEGKSVKEIAAARESTEKAVESKLSRLRLKLKRMVVK